MERVKVLRETDRMTDLDNCICIVQLLLGSFHQKDYCWDLLGVVLSCHLVGYFHIFVIIYKPLKFVYIYII